jgi:hypothetical protein
MRSRKIKQRPKIDFLWAGHDPITEAHIDLQSNASLLQRRSHL